MELYWKYVPELKGEYEFGRPCDCGVNRDRSAKRREDFADIPFQYRDLDWDSFRTDVYRSLENKIDAEAVKDMARVWTRNMDLNLDEGTGLYLYSKARGSGKTMLACVVANDLLRNGYQVKFTTTSDILMRIRESWDNKAVQEADIVRELVTAQVLIIDDIGVEGDKAWIRERFFHIINKRYEQRKPTIYTSNCEIMSLKVDTRVSSRIAETSLTLKFPNESIRAAQAFGNNERYKLKVLERRKEG